MRNQDCVYFLGSRASASVNLTCVHVDFCLCDMFKFRLKFVMFIAAPRPRVFCEDGAKVNSRCVLLAAPWLRV